MAHRLAPRLGAEQADLEAAAAQVHALRLGDFGDRQRVGRRRAKHAGTKVHDQRDLAFGRPARHRHDHGTKSFGPVVRAQAAGEQTVAVGVVHHVAGACAGGDEAARHQVGPGVDVLRRVAHDGRLAGGPRRRVQSRELMARPRKHAERVVLAQIGLERERQALQVVQRAQLVGVNACRGQTHPVRGHMVVGVAHAVAQPLDLQGSEFVARHRLQRRMQIALPAGGDTDADFRSRDGAHDTSLSFNVARRAPAGARARSPG